MDAKITFIEDAKNWWRMWSIQLGIIGASITSAFVAFPDAALYTWNMIPQDIKALLPAQYMPIVGVAISVTALIARLIVQKKLSELKAKQNDNQTTK